MTQLVFWDAVIAFRKYRCRETLETVLERKLSRGLSVPDELVLLSAADHRRAELAAQKNFDAGKVPAHVWGLV